MSKDTQFPQAREVVFENLEAILTGLNRCVAEGMLDPDNDYYNEILGLLEDARTADHWDELMEAVVRAKTLEIDIASWMSRQGRTTISYSWPKKPK